ncbi:hypothetical protein PACTADRAFT_140018 [Pachysolen tannophilus NRRL Y-2460]|uniref:PHD-type domain-containing protein n=1 Tax=Pachysolen tannophilus NRRL Y-2460 TaxID=669874 RepID=A0A1E4U0W4_PACTA|nr:hypothetical protein PACTADRAFT_140018 [Pachysolen tannophilus NRRL Y-2460]
MSQLNNDLESTMVTTVMNVSNSFISSLDHLPCDVVRSLWLIQSLNLSINQKFNDLNMLVGTCSGSKLQAPNVAVLSQISYLRESINRLKLEVSAECKHLLSKLNAHKNYLVNDTITMNEIVRLRKENLNKNDMESFKKFKINFLKKIGHNDVESELKMQKSGKIGRAQQEVINKNLIASDSASMGSLKKNQVKTFDKKNVYPIKLKLKSSALLSSQKKISSRPAIKLKIRTNNTPPPPPPPPPAQQPQQQQQQQQQQQKKQAPLAALPTGRSTIQQSIPDAQQPNLFEDTGPKYCYCRTGDSGKMIACDNPKCKIEWFHYKCLGFKTNEKVPDTWYCKPCTELMEKKKNKNKKKSTTSAASVTPDDNKNSTIKRGSSALNTDKSSNANKKQKMKTNDINIPKIGTRKSSRLNSLI